MTSMLLTDRIGRGVPLPALTPLFLLGAVALRVAELLAFLDRGRLDLRADDVTHRRDPVGDERPLLAVPLLDADRAVALVVLAADLERVREALHAEFLEALVAEVQVLEAPADLLGRRRRLGALHAGADGLGGVHRVDETAIVERLTHRLLLAGALALVVHVLDDV